MFVAWGEKTSGNVVMTYPERPQREGQHLKSSVLTGTKIEHSVEWSGSLSTQGMAGEMLWHSLVLKDSETVVENLYLQCKGKVLDMASVCQGFIVL